MKSISQPLKRRRVNTNSSTLNPCTQRMSMAFILSPRFIPLPVPSTRLTLRRRMEAVSSKDTRSSTELTNSSPNTNQESDVSVSDVLVQYVVLRRDLIDTWPLGSLVTQGCHASVAAIWSHKDDPLTLQYCSHLDSMHKVTLEVKGEEQIRNLSEKLNAGGIDHKLWIEHPENIPTCLATKPYPKSIVSSFFKRLKLCK